MIVGVGINTLLSPLFLRVQTTNLSNYSKKKIDNSKILQDIKITYGKFINQIKKHNYLFLKEKIK